jgi:hypothetical protein
MAGKVVVTLSHRALRRDTATTTPFRPDCNGLGEAIT